MSSKTALGENLLCQNLPETTLMSKNHLYSIKQCELVQFQLGLPAWRWRILCAITSMMLLFPLQMTLI